MNVVARHRREEKNRGHVLEAMDPASTSLDKPSRNLVPKKGKHAEGRD